MDITRLKPFDWIMLAQGTGLTFVLCLGALLFGGLVASLANVPTVWPRLRTARVLVILYVEVFRSTPLLLQLIAIYFALPLFGITVAPFVAAILGLVLYSGAYLTEIMRAGLQAVPRGQWETALSLGMSRTQAVRYVIFTQAARVAIPSIVSFTVMLVKGSSVVSVIGFVELTRAGRLVVEWTREAFAVWLVVAAIYFLICYPLSLLAGRLEKRLSHGTRSAAR
jgi:polar amino acid transport system permease protein